ncbi:MAG: 4-(cytidine 5'-diphospho)-2-C-methyl-D-erythritol kinase [Verrucomicrobia bacterium]|nr:4-(cytidine 5'-diphospho)-2-C-methyl-D-erythritol kinase [Verrucomicrobiota bacterium]
MFMALTRLSGCKVNFLLNILGRRADGFHELETVMHPVPLYDELQFATGGQGVQLTCSDPALPVDGGNLVRRAAELFLRTAGIESGVRIHLEKRIPLAAGLGGGSGDAATTLLGLNELFGNSLANAELERLAASLGSDVPFFLQSKPALATGRGERIQALDDFPALKNAFIVLIHPGFGVATAWAYQHLAKYPVALNGQPGRAARLIARLHEGNLAAASAEFFNSLEAPVLPKYPLLVLFQEFLRAHGASVALMSGSGSTTFALVEGKDSAEQLVEKFRAKFGTSNWTFVAKLTGAS